MAMVSSPTVACPGAERREQVPLERRGPRGSAEETGSSPSSRMYYRGAGTGAALERGAVPK